jgi:hypothetical protein
MLLSTKRMLGFRVNAADGASGTVQDFYFDDGHWTIRYLVVSTGSWLSGRSVLISPAALGTPDGQAQVIPVTLSAEQVCSSPDIGAHPPVSRQQEQQLGLHYGWPPYWDSSISPLAMATLLMPPESANPTETAGQNRGDPHLRSVAEVGKYRIFAKDGPIGHVVDFLTETDDWVIRYVVVDTRNWLPGRKVLISPAWVRRVDWSEALVHIDLDRKQIEASPEFDPTALVNREYETRLYDYYGRPAYWQ